MKKVFLGVGHGGSDPGAIGNNLLEKNINLQIALECRNVLEKHGVTVLLSRYKDEDDVVAEEVRECNDFKPDLAIDIHTNAGGGDGFEVFHSIVGGTGKILAEDIEKETVAIGQNSRGIKTKLNNSGTDYYGFIRNTNCPAVIAECAFIDSADIKIVDTLQEQKLFGQAYAKGILRSLDIEYKETIAEQDLRGYKNLYKFYINNVEADIESLLVGNNNYVKLRDIVNALSGRIEKLEGKTVYITK